MNPAQIKHCTLLLLITILYHFSINAQVVYSTPQFPTQNDTITLFYDAKQGNAALQNYDGDIYAHTGVISNLSNAPNDWQHVIGEWGTNDQRTLMKKESDNLYSLTFHIESYYQLGDEEIVEQLAFVFRNEDGSIVGRESDGSDIYLPIFPNDGSILIDWISPADHSIFYLNDELLISAELKSVGNAQVYFNDELFLEISGTLIDLGIILSEEGNFTITINIQQDGETISLSRNVVVINKEIAGKDAPANIQPGLNYLNDSTLIFKLTAPFKQHAFFLGNENKFNPDVNYRMQASIDATYFWIELPKIIFQNRNNTYQYLIDGNIRIADPFSTIILDPVNDEAITNIQKHNLPEYHVNATGHVSVIDVEPKTFNWEIEDFTPPKKADLIIYEILMRDFLDDQQFKTLKDSLDHFEKLGLNAIELMPIQEFEGNQSWGYNPSYHQALDKAYGTRDELKTLINECHKRNIAVIIDVVFNHAFSQSPLCQMYWDATAFRPDSSNPYFNTEAKHPFNVGYDANHESSYTKAWVKQVLAYWLEEFKIDGFRFDLSKGFTQKYSGNDASLMSQYDQSRIDILKEYADHIWTINEDGLVILEHFADTDEEKVLAAHGMLLWNNMQYQFAEAAMGYSSNLKGADYQSRGFEAPNLITYLESHDEERMAYKISQWGNSKSNYNTKELSTLTERMVAAYTIFMSIPGPKMLWQFSEFGYDYSINRCVSGELKDDCRLDPKPVFWNEINDPNRQLLFEKLSVLFHLKKNNPVFATTDYMFNDSDPYLKSVHLFHPEMDVVSLANFDVKERSFEVDFSSLGIWYEFYSGKELILEKENYTFNLKPGDYRVYTSKPIELAGQFPVSVNEFLLSDLTLYPNPVTEILNIQTKGNHIKIWNAQGILMKEQTTLPNKINTIAIKDLPKGLYFIQTKQNEHTNFVKL